MGSFGRRQINRLRLLASIGRDASVGNIYDHGVSVFRPSEIRALTGCYENPRDLASNDMDRVLRSLCRWDINHYLPENILTKVDRTTMAVSIEGREPLLDHRLIEMAMRIPQEMKMGPLGDKHILKKILYKNLPRELIDRPKQGFAIPVDSWMKNELKELVSDMLDTERIRNAGLFDANEVEGLRNSYFSGTPNLARKVWLLVAFELWREAWV